jgi:hypothetical protein
LQDGQQIATDTRDFSRPQNFQTGCGVQNPFLEAKRPGSNFDHSTSYNAKIKNAWSHTSTLSVCFHGVDMDNFAFTFSVVG